MNRILMTLLLALGLVLVPIGPTVHGQQRFADAAKIKADVIKRFTRKEERVKVRLRSGSEVKGRITQTSDNSFTLTDEKTGNHTDISYDDVLKLQGRGMSKTKKIVIATGIGVGVLVIVAVIAIRNFDPFKNGIVIR
jgi:small nuclear ribonucleoprotein (snRNP)-like protein